jgi:hypothetical protein
VIAFERVHHTVLAPTNKFLAKSNKSDAGAKATKKHEARSRRHCDSASEIRPTERESIPKGLHFEASPNTSSTKHKKASTMKSIPPESFLKDYKKRRSAFLEELIASTPNLSVRAKEFRRWIDENSPHNDNDEA